MSGGVILGAGRVPTRGRKGSADSLRAAAALVRRVERQAGCSVSEARIAPLRAVDTMLVTVPDVPPSAGRLRVLAAGVPTPGGAGVCVGTPLLLAAAAEPTHLVAAPPAAADAARIAVVPPGMGYEEAAARLRELLGSGVPVGAVLVAGDEGVLVANRLPGTLPVIDQVDTGAAAACDLLAVEVRPPGRSLTTLTDPVGLTALFGLDDADSVIAAGMCRTLTDRSNAVVGSRPTADPAPPEPDEPWVLTAGGRRLALREACLALRDWAPGTVRAFGTSARETAVDDLFAVDLAVVAEAATARPGTVGRAILVASLSPPVPTGPETRGSGPADTHAAQLAAMLSMPVRCLLTEPAAARLGALTTPGARDDALVIDLGAGTIDVIAVTADVVAAGAGELLTAAIAELLGIPRAAADWVKRGPCLRVDGGRRFEAEDGTRGFLDVAPPVSAVGMLAVTGPGGLLPFDRRHGPGEWRALRIRIKQAVLNENVRRAVRALGQDASQVLVVGGPAGDEELLGVLAGSFPPGVPVGRGNASRRGSAPLGHRYAVALGLALAGPAPGGNDQAKFAA